MLATLGKNIGEVKINLYNNNLIHIVKAHNSAIRTMSLNANGTLLATASSKGTLIRIFDTQNGKKIREFRRGTQTAIIRSIAFSKDSSALCVSSDNGTIHLFFINSENKNSNRQSR